MALGGGFRTRGGQAGLEGQPGRGAGAGAQQGGLEGLPLCHLLVIRCVSGAQTRAVGRRWGWGKAGWGGRDLVKFQEKLCNKRNYKEGRDSSGGNTRQQEEAREAGWPRPGPGAHGPEARGGSFREVPEAGAAPGPEASGSPSDQAWGVGGRGHAPQPRGHGHGHTGTRSHPRIRLGDRESPSSGPTPSPRPFPSSHRGPGLPPAPMGLSLPLSTLFSEPAENGSLVTNMAPGHWVTLLFPCPPQRGLCSLPAPLSALPGPPPTPLPPPGLPPAHCTPGLRGVTVAWLWRPHLAGAPGADGPGGHGHLGAATPESPPSVRGTHGVLGLSVTSCPLGEGALPAPSPHQAPPALRPDGRLPTTISLSAEGGVTPISWRWRLRLRGKCLSVPVAQ